ncbi:hypothetical protein [Marichromatium bheemlicum]|uniref:Uncharacterized protein n=1 Tax=Marichromatium bheemlicum TaxID=365339 RepID=A0ABX1I6Z7_9GAMM|nr:hypothetical protein [Marichromatium bheemlicum]NKN33257.1 hypothetical protein [Marichromatium bheemlicum]
MRQIKMKQIKRTADYTIYQKRSGRYAVHVPHEKRWVNGEAKETILRDEQLIPGAGAQPTAD